MPIASASRPGKLARVKAYVFNHKVRLLVLFVLVFGGAYFAYGKMTAKAQPAKYTLVSAATETIVSSVSGSGQVSPSSDISLSPKASGQITSVLVKEGQYVTAGQAIATIDNTSALQNLRDAQSQLKSAQLSLAKLQKPADQLTLTQAQDAISKAQSSQTTAQSNLAKAYADADDDIVNTYLDMPALMASFKDIVIGTTASRGSQWNVDYYLSAVVNWDSQAQIHRDTAYNDYVAALATYNKALAHYKAMPVNPSNDEIGAMVQETYKMSQDVDNALSSSNAFIQYYEDTIKEHNQNPSSVADTALSNLSSYINKMSTHSSTLLADSNTITSGKQSIDDAARQLVESQQSLAKLQEGADDLDVQTSQLSIQQRQDAIVTAQENLADYTIRAPFAGYIANLTAVKGAQSSGSIATLMTKDQIAELSLNEVDAAKVKVGQKVTLTFDAISNLTLAGTVVSINPLGTVSQGVVSYTVNIDFASNDDRVKPGMTVNASIITGTATDAITVPTGAIKKQGDTSYVLVVKNPPAGAADSGSAVELSAAPQQVTVTTGLTDDTSTQIVSGLSVGDVVVSKTSTAATTKTTTTTSTNSTRSLFGGGGGGPPSGGGGGR